MLIVTRTINFCAAHRLYNPDWSAEKNAQIFGKCANEGGHGHNYQLKVSVTGELNEETGMIINVAEIKKILNHEIFDKLDHKNLNSCSDFLENKISTMENLVLLIAKKLKQPFDNLGVKLVKLELNENNKNSVTLNLTK